MGATPGCRAPTVRRSSAGLAHRCSAYSSRRQTKARSFVRVRKRTVWSLAEARETLEKLVGQSLDWSPLDQYLVAYLVEASMIPTVLASTFAASLELVREGHIEAHQQGSFTPLYLRKKQSGGGDTAGVTSAESGNA